MHAVADLGRRVWHEIGLQSAGDRPPRLTGVVAPKRAGGGDGGEDPRRVARIQQDGVQAHAAGARLPAGPRAVAAQSRQFLPRRSAVDGTEQGGVFHPGVHRLRIGQRWLQMPDALELPGAGSAVIVLVSADLPLVNELVAHWLPGLAAIVGALHQLAEPAAGLRGVQPIRVDGRALHVIDFPTPKVGAGHIPLLALAVRCQHERTLLGAHQNAYATHNFTLPWQFTIHGIPN
jgi:hypothetical protein